MPRSRRVLGRGLLRASIIAALDDSRGWPSASQCATRRASGSFTATSACTWAGARANATLIAGLPGIAHDSQRHDNFRVRLRGAQAAEKLEAALDAVDWSNSRPAVSHAALAGLKFSEVLPPDLAVVTIAERIADRDGAAAVAAESRVWSVAT